MSKLICHYKKNEKGSWDLSVITTMPECFKHSANTIIAVSTFYPRSRTAGINKMLAILWMMKPGEAFTITTNWEDKNGIH